jgi:hypothetical protein
MAMIEASTHAVIDFFLLLFLTISPTAISPLCIRHESDFEVQRL